MSNLDCVLLFWPNYIENKDINRELIDAGIKSFFFDIYNKYTKLLAGSKNRASFISTLCFNKNTSLFYQGIKDNEIPASADRIWNNKIEKDSWYKILKRETDIENEKRLIKIRLNVKNSSLKRLFCWWVAFQKDDMFIDVLFPIEWCKTK